MHSVNTKFKVIFNCWLLKNAKACLAISFKSVEWICKPKLIGPTYAPGENTAHNRGIILGNETRTLEMYVL